MPYYNPGSRLSRNTKTDSAPQEIIDKYKNSSVKMNYTESYFPKEKQDRIWERFDVKAAQLKDKYGDWGEYLHEFIKHKRVNGMSYSSTWKTYNYCMKYLDFIKREGLENDIETLMNPKTVLQYKNEIVNKRTLGQVHALLTYVYNFLRFVSIMGFVEGLGLEKVERMKELGKVRVITQKTRKVLTEEDFEIVVAATAAAAQNSFEKARNVAILYVFFYCGLRLNEMSNIKISDIEVDRISKLKVVGKGGKIRYIPLNDKVVVAIRKYLAERNDDMPYLFSVFIKRRTNKKDKESYIRKMDNKEIGFFINDMLVVTGYKKPDDNVSTHTFRRSFATNLMKKNANLKYIQEVMGHSNINTSLGYIHFTELDFEEEFKRLEGKIEKNIEEKPIKKKEEKPADIKVKPFIDGLDDKPAQKEKPVMQYTLQGKFIHEFPSVESVKEHGFSPKKVSNAAVQSVGAYKGYIWLYKYKKDRWI